MIGEFFGGWGVFQFGGEFLFHRRERKVRQGKSLKSLRSSRPLRLIEQTRPNSEIHPEVEQAKLRFVPGCFVSTNFLKTF